MSEISYPQISPEFLFKVDSFCLGVIEGFYRQFFAGCKELVGKNNGKWILVFQVGLHLLCQLVFTQAMVGVYAVSFRFARLAKLRLSSAFRRASLDIRRPWLKIPKPTMPRQPSPEGWPFSTASLRQVLVTLTSRSQIARHNRLSVILQVE